MEYIVTGSNGLLGSSLKRKIDKEKLYPHTRANCDLTNKISTDGYLSLVFDQRHKDKHPDTLIHCAAKVGGVKANMNDNYGFFEKNVSINRNIIDNCYKYNVKNVVSILSTCIFPGEVEYPLTAEKIDNGFPHKSNFGYAFSKRLLRYETELYRNLTGNNWISVIPTNMYGSNDNFNLDDSHLLPALIRKAHESSERGEDFEVWGDGTPLRQFVMSDDMADIILWAIDNWKSDKPLMAVNEKEWSIQQVVDIISDRFKIPDSKIKYDTSKPNGQHRKPAKSDIPDWNFTPLEEGINKTIDWFLENKDDIRS